MSSRVSPRDGDQRICQARDVQDASCFARDSEPYGKSAWSGESRGAGSAITLSIRISTWKYNELMILVGSEQTPSARASVTCCLAYFFLQLGKEIRKQCIKGRGRLVLAQAPREEGGGI